MKKPLLVFALILTSSAPLFAQENTEKIAANFKFNWNDHLLPNCSFLIYHGKGESYFLDSSKNRVPNHSYLDIKTGGKDHFIVQSEEGYHLLNTKLEKVTENAYDNIVLYFGSEIRLTRGDKLIYYVWNSEKNTYVFLDELEPKPAWAVGPEQEKRSKLGKVNDSRFRAKRIERLRLGIDMSKTLKVEQKGKNVLVKKGENIVFKGPTKPMLFYDFAITGAKAPHAIYHPTSAKKPILENCDHFWFVGSFLVVSVKGSPQKHIISNTGEIILSSSGEIRHYNYEFGGRKYAFFCDGRSVVNMNGDLIYKSDGELIGVGEHYIYAGYNGAYLGDLSHTVKMDCSSFDRFRTITVGKTGRNAYRVYDAQSVLVNKIQDYYIDKRDSAVVCVEESKTVICDPYEGKVVNAYPLKVRGEQDSSEEWKYYITTKDQTDTSLEGRFDPKKGVIVEAKYLKIEWPASEKYHIVLTKDGHIRYLDATGKELFD